MDNYIFETWKPTHVIISHWVKYERVGEKIRKIPLRLLRTEKVSDMTGEVRYFFKIESPENPIPVKGEFESGFDMLSNFLKKADWILQPKREEIRYVYK